MADPDLARPGPLDGSGDGSRERIRVLQFSSVVNRDDFIDTLARHGDPERFEFAVCSYRPSNIRDPEYDDDGIRHFMLPEPRSRWVHPGVIHNLARVIKAWRPHIVHAHHFYESVEAVLAARMASRRVATIYGRHFSDEFYVSLRGVNRRLHVALDNWLLRAADRVIVPTEEIVELVGRQASRTAGLHQVPYPCDFSAAKYRRPAQADLDVLAAELGLQEDGLFVVGNLGRHHPIKGQDTLIDAFARFSAEVPEARLLMIGDGDYRASLESLAERLSVRDRVVFTGWRTDAPVVLCLSDVVVQASRQEAFPQMMVETMALGLPLVSTPVSGTRLMLQPGVTGLQVPHADAEAILNALRTVYVDPALREALGRQGRAHVRRTLEIPQIIPRYEAVYEDLAR